MSIRCSQYILAILFLGLWVIPCVWTDEAGQSSQGYLISGIYYFVNEGNMDKAEELFRKAIFSSSFAALSNMENTDCKISPLNRRVAAEAFYFLGRIYYKRANDQQDTIQNIAWAKKYFQQADEYGIVYDKLHPPIMDEINRKYPGIGMPTAKPSREKSEVVIEVNNDLYRIDAVKVDQRAGITKDNFLTNERFELEGGARYKLKPNIKGQNNIVNQALVILGVSLVLWFARG